LNSFQNFIFINKFPPPRRCRPGPRDPCPPCYAADAKVTFSRRCN